MTFAIDPSGSIHRDWNRLLKALAAAIEREGGKDLSLESVKRFLVGTRVLPATTPDMLRRLRELRDRAVERPDLIQPQQAALFNELAGRLVLAAGSRSMPDDAHEDPDPLR